jgi:hypothetical protein
MGLLLFIVFGCLAGGCGISVQHTVARRMHLPFNAWKVRHSVDAYVWAVDASKSLRRRYITSYCCTFLALISLAYFAATHGPQTDHTRGGVFIAVVMATYLAGNLVWKLYRLGR